jgi:hypothetical protein
MQLVSAGYSRGYLADQQADLEFEGIEPIAEEADGPLPKPPILFFHRTLETSPGVTTVTNHVGPDVAKFVWMFPPGSSATIRLSDLTPGSMVSITDSTTLKSGVSKIENTLVYSFSATGNNEEGGITISLPKVSTEKTALKPIKAYPFQ